MNDKLIVSGDMTLLDAMKYMDRIERKLLIVCDQKHFLGLISIGDIQRAIIHKCNLSENVTKHIRGDILFARSTDDINKVRNLMMKNRTECMPIVDDSGELVDIIEWEDIISKDVGQVVEPIKCPVVIMAGGKGTRLKPLTNVIPKPLIPISEKTIIEDIMDRFVAADCHDFYLSLNYKADTIKNYFASINNKNYNIKYLTEKKPLGTGGALYLLKDKIQDTFLVSNCDIVVDINLADLLRYHRNNKNIATMVSVIKNIDIPYGILETKENGMLSSIREKPILTYQINSGLYVLEPKILDYIGNEEFIHLPDLLLRAKQAGENIGVFPVSEGSWSDMGNWDEYLSCIRKGQNI